MHQVADDGDGAHLAGTNAQVEGQYQGGHLILELAVSKALGKGFEVLIGNGLDLLRAGFALYPRALRGDGIF
ncbi:hypothetical protein D9M68_903310 [compost metagenome]